MCKFYYLPYVHILVNWWSFTSFGRDFKVDRFEVACFLNWTLGFGWYVVR